MSLMDLLTDVLQEDRSSVALQALMVPELLEIILLELPLTDLLANMPRVCKHCKAIIDGSIKIQRALFFKPSADVLLEQRWEGYALFNGTKDVWVHSVIANPFIQQLNNEYLVGSSGAGHMSMGVDRPEASWRRMLAAQPPHVPRRISLAGVRLSPLWVGLLDPDIV